MSRLAEMYEARYPGALKDEAHKEERMQRELFKQDRRAHRRTGRNTGIVVPALPWLKETA